MPSQSDFIRRNPQTQFKNIRILTECVIITVVDRVLTGADAEAVGISAVVACKVVVALSAFKGIVAISAVERIVT